MKFCLVVFKSRNETMYLANMLLSSGYRVNIINTPREVGQACGISVQFGENMLAVVKKVLASKPFRTFAGVFRVSAYIDRKEIERIA